MATPYSALNSRNAVRRENLFPTLWALPNWAHPEVVYYYDDWKMIRDAVAGSKEVKAENTRYLPKMDTMSDSEYLAYIERATYYNFAGQTLNALAGTIFRRRPVLENVPERIVDNLETVGINAETFEGFASVVASELLALGRVGVLIDLPDKPTTTPKPYFVHYSAEHILDWDTDKDDDGRARLTRIVLREMHLTDGRTAGERKYVAMYRVLTLENGVYHQEVFKSDTDHADITPEYSQGKITPKRAGETLSEIPFMLFSRGMNSFNVEKPILYDIAQLNISHYQSYAQLEQGRFFTGFPIYYAEIPQGSDGGMDYELAPSRVWEVPSGTKPGLLEFYGQGLAFLEKALDTKEHQAAALGGRIIGIKSGATSESNNTEKMKQLNEHAMLLAASKALDQGFTRLLRVWAWWSGITKAAADKISVEFNKDFLFSDIGSREFRAIHALYKDGVIPIDVVYQYLKKALVIPDWMDEKEFKKLLDKMDSFPNQVNVEAMMEGYPDKKTQLEQKNLEQEREDDKKAQEMAAKNPPPPPNAPPPGPNSLNGPGRPPQNPNQPAKTV